MNFFGEQFATFCVIGHICIECFCFVFFYEKHIRDFLKRREKIVSRTFLPDMGRGGEHIVFDNASNLACYRVAAQVNRFRCEEQFRIAQEQFRIGQGQFRIAQGEIITASGVSISIALTEGGGV